MYFLLTDRGNPRDPGVLDPRKYGVFDYVVAFLAFVLVACLIVFLVNVTTYEARRSV